MSSHAMVKTYGQQMCLHLLITHMQLATIYQKLQLKWSPTHYSHVAQVVHFEKLKSNNKLIIFVGNL
jgi:hypothetical protein